MLPASATVFGSNTELIELVLNAEICTCLKEVCFCSPWPTPSCATPYT